MLKFFLKVFLFFAMIALLDVISGYCFDYLKSHARSGDTRKNYVIGETCEDDVLILGSSRAARHYVPSIIQDSLNLSCYNCGEPGCGIITAYARYRMIAERHKPKLVVYEVSPGYDYFSLDDNSKYLGRVRQYVDKKPVRELFLALGDCLERFRLMSEMYENNSFIVHNIVDNYVTSDDDKGFKPLHGQLKDHSKVTPRQNVEKSKNVLDSLKLSYMERLIIELKKDSIPMCFMVSPRYEGEDSLRSDIKDFEPLITLCDKHRVPFVDYTFSLGEISHDYRYFQDFGHMNEKGACAYTRIICKELKRYLKR